MDAPALVQPLRLNSPSRPIIERFLRDRESVWQQIGDEVALPQMIGQMLVSSGTALACYGAVIGIFSQQPLQALSSAVKLPLLFLLTLLLCLPTLYLLNLLWNGQLSVPQLVALTLSAITVASAMLLAFAPVTFFFLVTTTHSYPFFVLLNVAILGFSSITGLQFLVQGSHYLNARLVREAGEPAEDAPPAPRAYAVHATLLRGWLLLYAFVGTQLAWTLRPFFGWPDHPFILFDSLNGNFYLGVAELLGWLLMGR